MAELFSSNAVGRNMKTEKRQRNKKFITETSADRSTKNSLTPKARNRFAVIKKSCPHKQATLFIRLFTNRRIQRNAVYSLMFDNSPLFYFQPKRLHHRVYRNKFSVGESHIGKNLTLI